MLCFSLCLFLTQLILLIVAKYYHDLFDPEAIKATVFTLNENLNAKPI